MPTLPSLRTNTPARRSRNSHVAPLEDCRPRRAVLGAQPRDTYCLKGIDLFVPRSSTYTDESAITDAISGLVAAECATISIPSYVRDEVKANLAELATSDDWQPIANESKDDPRVIPDAAWDDMNAPYASALERYCTDSFGSSDGMRSAAPNVAALRNAELYNNPAEPLVTEERSKVMAVDVKKNDGAACVAWAYVWVGDLTASGPHGQGWSVDEYTLVNQDGRWLIDGRRTLGILAGIYDENDQSLIDQWGPYAPHGSTAQMEVHWQSQLYPDLYAADAQAELESLEAAALTCEAPGLQDR